MVEVLDPWTLVSDAEAATARGEGGEVAFLRLIGARNAGAIDSADLVIAVLDGQEVDAGVAAEVGYAAGRGIRCVGLRTDLRQTGEDGAIVNLQVQWFLERDGGSIAGSVEELLALIPLPGPPAR